MDRMVKLMDRCNGWCYLMAERGRSVEGRALLARWNRWAERQQW